MAAGLTIAYSFLCTRRASARAQNAKLGRSCFGNGEYWSGDDCGEEKVLVMEGCGMMRGFLERFTSPVERLLRRVWCAAYFGSCRLEENLVGRSVATPSEEESTAAATHSNAYCLPTASSPCWA